MDGRADEGFTVIELVISMMIMLVITVPLVTSFVLGVQTTIGSQQDVTNSADAQILGYYFDIDVASAETVAVATACGGTGTVLELTWTDGTTQVVAYRGVADATRQAELQVAFPIYRLERVQCNGAGTTVTVMARSLRSLPTVSCDGASCSATPRPRRIGIQVVEHSTTQSDIGTTDRFTFGVTAVRKVSP